MRRRLYTSLVLTCAIGAAVSGPLAANAIAANGSQVISDCNSHGTLTQHYSVAQLRAALSTMPADVKEYTDCYDVIQRTLLAQLGGRHGGGATPSKSSSGGSFLPTALIVILVLLAIAAASFAVVAARRRREP